MFQSGTLARHGEVLARAAEGDDVDGLNLCAAHLADVSEVLHLGEACPRDRYGIGFNLCRPSRLDSAEAPREGEAAGAVKKGSEFVVHFVVSLLVFS